MSILHRTITSSLLTIATSAMVSLTPAALGQFDSENVSLYAHLNLGQFPSNPANGNDCWGYVSPSGREYALMGLEDALAVVEITTPSSPVIIGSISHNSSLWADVKVYQDHAYVVNESGGGMDVIDLGDVDNGNVTLVRRVTGGLSTSHNLAIDTESGYLYLCGPNINGGDMVCYDLSTPSNPVRVGDYVGSYFHDAQAVTYTSGPYAGREIVFGCSENRGIDIVDVTNKSNMFRIARRSYPGVNYCHQGWLSDDRQYFYVNDELDELNGATATTRTIVFDVSDINNPVFVDTFTTGLSSTDHNLYWHNGYIFEANYTSGLRIFDTTSDPVNPTEIGYFDTYPGGNFAGFEGAWSCYPYFPSGTVIVSDINRGLFILDVSAAISGLSFGFPNGLPETIDPSGGTTIRVEVTGNNVVPEPGTGSMFVDTGAGFIEFPMTQVTDNIYDAVFPASTCGTDVQYYFRAEDTASDAHTSPSGAPVNSYSAFSAAGLEFVFTDNFETDLGWSVQNTSLDDGAWERGIPAGDGSRGDPLNDFDGSGRCYLTGNRSGNSDVDGGPTRLLSPSLNLTTAPNDTRVEFAIWHFNDDGDDPLDIHISNNGSTWFLMDSLSSTAGWEKRSYVITDFVSLSNNVQVRFSSSDQPNDSVTESAVDAFNILYASCSPALTLDVDPLFWGQNATLRATNATPNEEVFFAYSVRGTGATFVPQLNVTLGIASPKLGGTAFADATGLATFTSLLPDRNGSLVIWMQAAEFGRASNVVLTQINN